MSDSTPTPTPETPTRAPRKRRRTIAIVVGVAILGSMIAVPLAIAGHHWRHGHNLSDDEVRERVDRGVDRFLDRIDATDAQRDAIDDIILEAFPGAMALRKEGRALKQSIRAVLLTEEPDRAELERLRREAVDLFDRGTAKALDVLLKVDDELTVEQREVLQERLQRRWTR